PAPTLPTSSLTSTSTPKITQKPVGASTQVSPKPTTVTSPVSTQQVSTTSSQVVPKSGKVTSTPISPAKVASVTATPTVLTPTTPSVTPTSVSKTATLVSPQTTASKPTSVATGSQPRAPKKAFATLAPTVTVTRTRPQWVADTSRQECSRCGNAFTFFSRR